MTLQNLSFQTKKKERKPTRVIRKDSSILVGVAPQNFIRCRFTKNIFFGAFACKTDDSWTREKTIRNCTEAKAVQSLWQQTGLGGECGQEVFFRLLRKDPCMVKRCRPSFLWTELGLFWGISELSHASTTIFGLVHLFIFYIFHLMKPQRRTCAVVFGL